MKLSLTRAQRRFHRHYSDANVRWWQGHKWFQAFLKASHAHPAVRSWAEQELHREEHRREFLTTRSGMVDRGSFELGANVGSREVLRDLLALLGDHDTTVYTAREFEDRYAP